MLIKSWSPWCTIRHSSESLYENLSQPWLAFVNLTEASVTGEEKTSMEKMPPTRLACGLFIF